jgi:hypothetical protein
MVRGRTVNCNQIDTDPYGRAVCICAVGGQDINGAMVQAGHAVAYREFSRAYVANEESAKAAGRGLWVGQFQMPAEVRRPTIMPLGARTQLPATVPNVRDKDCSDFSTRAQAQVFFLAQGASDPHRLDGDHDGLACETLP